MATAQEMIDSLESFAQSCKENERLTAMIRDWNRVLHIEASDLAMVNTLVTDGGIVTTEPGAIGNADMVIHADSDILTQVFYGEVSPNEPYNDGTLRIKGAEEDIVRLDFVIAMLWD
jgi:putative sterol carrier protein